MPNITSDATEAVRLWLRERDWDYQRLADECNSIDGLDADDWAAGGVRNAVNGYDPVRAGRINRLAVVTQAYPTRTFPDGLTYDFLVGADEPAQPTPPNTPEPRPESDAPKVDPTAPPARRNGKRDRSGPPRSTAHVAVGAA